jgi:FkbM family methyltransferase
MNAEMQRDLIYDVGLHKGEDSEFYLRKGFRVIAIEALPALVQYSKQRLRDYVESGQLVILNCAIAEHEGPVEFFETPGWSVWGTIRPDWEKRNEELGQRSVKQSVAGVRFSSILEQYGIPYYLKVDIEGADLLCLEALKGCRSKPRYVSIESNKCSWAGLNQEFTLLGELGYSRFKVVPQVTVPMQECPRPAMEGRFVDWQFDFFASGLFGDEAPGDWLSKLEALRKYECIFRQYKIYEAVRKFRMRRLLRRLLPDPGWFDTHAAMPL